VLQPCWKPPSRISSLATLSVRLPLQEFAEQALAIGIAHWHVGLIAQGGLERGALLRLLLLHRHLLQQLLRHAGSRPAGHGGGQIHVAPFRMVRRMLERIPAAEQIFDEALDPVVAVGVLWPIEDGKHRWDCDRVDTVLTLEQIGVLLLCELTERVKVLVNGILTRCRPEFCGILLKKSIGFGMTRTMASTWPDCNFCNAVG